MAGRRPLGRGARRGRRLALIDPVNRDALVSLRWGPLGRRSWGRLGRLALRRLALRRLALSWLALSRLRTQGRLASGELLGCRVRLGERVGSWGLRLRGWNLASLGPVGGRVRGVGSGG